ncbi:glycosyl hydrolase family 95 catalytic domain-containing protein [Sphingobacterium paludis]|uniref:Glycosyl hydrolase family 65 n=1 Tax=Sphingobacterium paludis TaxID=1476465 RepID=A0A4R7DE54_9SPHI|nr:glycoside hydrolase N-terminal domain-containing protein [Sphingobacterium paludis]TDS17456.1 glycosyl hydrolase family 65 [Sphingobacterium paludis]
MNKKHKRMALALLIVLGACKSNSQISHEAPARGFHSNRPAQKWEESLVSGNGRMGVMVQGSPYNESIVFNHALLYLPLHKPLKPVSQGKHIDEIRELMLAKKFEEGAQFVVDLANSEGYNGKHATDCFIPGFQLNLVSDSTKVNTYRRSVDFESGEIDVQWQNDQGEFSRKTFVSRADNVVVIRLQAFEGAEINTTLDIKRILTHDDARKGKYQLDDNLGIKRMEISAIDSGITCRAWYNNPWEGSYLGYHGAIKVTHANGKISAQNNQLTIHDATEVVLLARIEPSKTMKEDEVVSIQKSLTQFGSNYEHLLEEHRKLHKSLFNQVRLDLHASAQDRMKSSEELLELGGEHPALIEKLFDAARYNAISATGINPPNLQGIWGATMTPPWSGDYTTNGNLPVAISHFLQANTPELMLPLFDNLENYLEDFRTNAKELYNCRGIHVPSRYSTHGLNNHWDATWPMTFWTIGAAWYSMFYYDYYLYTQDEQFLRTRALPFMEESALFYSDFLKEGTDGKYVFNPSYSPENHPLNYKSQACINATMDVMAVNALLRALISVSQKQGINKEKIALWEDMLSKMPTYQVNAEGELREWVWDDLADNHNHRHASHLLGLFDLHDPLIVNNKELRLASKKVIDRRMEIRRQENGGIMAFGMIQLAFAATALGENETAYDMLTWLGNSYWNNNLVSTHDPKKTFNLDISGGYPSLVMKMLTYAEPGLISLLPCKPDSWHKGSITDLALRGGIIVRELKWEGDQIEAMLVSKIDQTVAIRLKGQAVKELFLKAGEQTPLRL